MLEEAGGQDVYLRHAGSLALARLGDAEALIALTGHASGAVRMGAVLALRRMKHEGVSAFLADADEFVVTEAARAINDDGGIPEALPSLAALLDVTSFEKRNPFCGGRSARTCGWAAMPTPVVWRPMPRGPMRPRRCARKPSPHWVCGKNPLRSIG